MPRHSIRNAAAHASGHVPGVRRLPVVQVLALAEVALLVRQHMRKLDAAERRRLYHLVRVGRGRRQNLSGAEQEELRGLVMKMEPRQFVAAAVEKLSPVPVPAGLMRTFGGR